jgi:hypothetical protein
MWNPTTFPVPLTNRANFKSAASPPSILLLLCISLFMASTSCSTSTRSARWNPEQLALQVYDQRFGTLHSSSTSKWSAPLNLVQLLYKYMIGALELCTAALQVHDRHVGTLHSCSTSTWSASWNPLQLSLSSTHIKGAMNSYVFYVNSFVRDNSNNNYNLESWCM